MKITKDTLRKIIKEEWNKMEETGRIEEMGPSGLSVGEKVYYMEVDRLGRLVTGGGGFKGKIGIYKGAQNGFAKVLPPGGGGDHPHTGVVVVGKLSDEEYQKELDKLNKENDFISRGGYSGREPTGGI